MEAASKFSDSLSGGKDTKKSFKSSTTNDSHDSHDNAINVAVNLPEHAWEDKSGPELIHRIERAWGDVFLAVLFTPLQMCKKSYWTCDKEVLICFGLWLIGFIPGIIYYFQKDFVPLGINIACCLFPPMGLG